MVHPLAETFTRTHDACYGAHVGARPEGAWLSAAAVGGDEAALRGLIDIAAAGYATDRRDIRGIRLLELWTWLLVSPAAAALLLARRLPDLAAERVDMAAGLYLERWPVALRSARFWCLPGDPDAGHPDAVVVADEAALLARLRVTLADEHLAPLVDTIAAMTARSRRSLWRCAADRVVNAFSWTGEQLDRLPEAHRLAALAVSAPGPLHTAARVEHYVFDGLGAHEVHVRDGCCLYYRVSDATMCLACPLMDEPERERRAQEQRRQRVPGDLG